MAGYLPPPPTQNPDTNTRVWQDWYRQLQKYLTGLSTLDWSLLDLTDASLADIPDRKHNDLQSIQGGTTSEYYHLTSTQHTDLTDSGDSALHYHSSDRNRTNHTGTQTLSTISDAGALAALSVVTEGEITLADVTTNDVSISKHGFVPKAPNDTTKYLRGDGTWQTVSGVTADAVEAVGYWSPLTDGDLTAPELIFADGDAIMVWTDL